MGPRPHLGDVPPPERAPEPSRGAALWWRAADARYRASPDNESHAADHGRAIRGPRADTHRERRGTPAGAQGSVAVDAARRAELRACDQARGADRNHESR